jgi:hypothetical protein
VDLRALIDLRDLLGRDHFDKATSKLLHAESLENLHGALDDFDRQQNG